VGRARVLPLALPLVWGLRLHLLATVHGLPVGYALTGAKDDERQVLLGILDDPALTTGRTGQIIIGDKNYYGRGFEAALAGSGMHLLRPPRKGEDSWPGAQFLQAAAPNHRIGQRHLQRPARPRTPRRAHPPGVITRVLQRILALTAAIWHNDRTGQPVHRSLIAYDH